MRLISLNSGSNANCYVAGAAADLVMLDAGLSCKETLARLQQAQLPQERIKALFVSHEHSDHIKGVEVLAKRLQLPVFISKATYQKSGLSISPNQVNFIYPGASYCFGETVVDCFSKQHDAVDPYSFVVSDAFCSSGIITDVGHACENVIDAVKKCSMLLLESNYDEDLLHNGPYPYYLKQRIAGDKGHLSNTQALHLMQHHLPEHLQCLVLGHLSKENNQAKLVHDLFSKHFPQCHIHVASRYEISPTFEMRQTEHGPQLHTYSQQTQMSFNP